MTNVINLVCGAVHMRECAFLLCICNMGACLPGEVELSGDIKEHPQRNPVGNLTGWTQVFSEGLKPIRVCVGQIPLLPH
jgi:hypothetical protein